MDESKKNIIISPSGNLYGSENVIYDFISSTNKNYKIYVPKNSLFYEKLNKEGFNVVGFKVLLWLYFKIFLLQLFFKKNIILNESGHIRYIKLLAKFFKNRKYVVFVRLLEDCNSNLHQLPENITLIAVSEYIKSNITSNLTPKVIYDPYQLNENLANDVLKDSRDMFTIAVVGRIIKTKGLDAIIEIFNYSSFDCVVQLNFYGTFDENSTWFLEFKSKLDKIKMINYKFMGFVGAQEDIYKNTDLILHVNKVEALGRIIFESIDFNTPFLCFEAGGAGELAGLLNLSNYTALNTSDMALKINELITNRISRKKDFSKARKNIKGKFDSNSYVFKIESFL